MNGEYLAVTAAQLDKAIKEPGWALKLAYQVMDAEGEPQRPPAEARCMTTHKAWHAIAFLLERAGFRDYIVYGDQALTDEDWGYGPPRYLTPERVREAADALANLSYNDLIAEVAPADLSAAEIYPSIWDDEDALEWVRGWFEDLEPFFRAAAGRGDAMLTWLD
ncbi:YfbM family protein [Actinomadura graeca]|uniref:YfbM family protein n=2 Tax=Actinomadura graeca TaxID=2750812 RepID=A0ABX8R7U5_9ACTN|nr:YfbM family protein [Actinomadura graeca]